MAISEELDFKLMHVGVAVPALEPATEFLGKLFGYRVISGPFEDPLQKVRVNFLTLAPTDIAEVELVAPLAEDSPVRSILKRNSGGAYHLCFETNEIEKALEHAVSQGCVIVAEPAPAVAFGGRRIAWIYSKTQQLFELVEAEKAPA